MADRLVMSPDEEQRVVSGSWWWAYDGRRDARKAVPGYAGYWLLPARTGNQDERWQAVASATWRGRLGPYSKTDAFPPVDGYPLLLHVYTADYRDSEDLRRVLREARGLGFAGEFGYFECAAAQAHAEAPLYTAVTSTLRLVRHREGVGPTPRH